MLYTTNFIVTTRARGFVLAFSRTAFSGGSVAILSVVHAAGMACSTLVGAPGVDRGREVLALCGRHHAATWHNFQPDLGNPSIAPCRVDFHPSGDLHDYRLFHRRIWSFRFVAIWSTMA